MGMRDIGGMDDAQLRAHWNTPQGQKDNIRIGTAYLGKQLTRYDGDIEAALIAYNAGPANADKWLNGGRDYALLPKAEETAPYVRKVIGAWKGIDVGQGGSADVQAALRGGNAAGKTYYQGDAKGFLKGKLQKQHGAEHVDGMDGAMADRVAAMFSDAPDFVKGGLDIMSGKRSTERQQQLWEQAVRKYGSEAAARCIAGSALLSIDRL